MPDTRIIVSIPGVPKVTVNNVGLPGPAGADGAPGPNITASDVEVTDATNGIILKTSDNTRARITLEKDGDSNLLLKITQL